MVKLFQNKYFIVVLLVTATLILLFFANTGHISFTKEIIHEQQPGGLAAQTRHSPTVNHLSKPEEKANVIHDDQNQISQEDQEQHAQSKEMGRNCQPLHFIHEHPMPRTALASFPGSGNTWVRHLLQQATGIYTGSIYGDKKLISTGFLGEKVTNGSVLVIKTHGHPQKRADVSFDRAVVLTRNPLDACLAEFNRKQSSSNHTGVANNSLFTKKVWTNGMSVCGPRWSKFIKNWAGFQKPVLVVAYEDLKTDMKTELLRMLNFLDVNITQEHLECTLRNSQGQHKRQHSVSYEVYTEDMLEELLDYTSTILEELKSFQMSAPVKEIMHLVSRYSKRINELL